MRSKKISPKLMDKLVLARCLNTKIDDLIKERDKYLGDLANAGITKEEVETWEQVA